MQWDPAAIGSERAALGSQNWCISYLSLALSTIVRGVYNSLSLEPTFFLRAHVFSEVIVSLEFMFCYILFSNKSIESPNWRLYWTLEQKCLTCVKTEDWKAIVKSYGTSKNMCVICDSSLYYNQNLWIVPFHILVFVPVLIRYGESYIMYAIMYSRLHLYVVGIGTE